MEMCDLRNQRSYDALADSVSAEAGVTLLRIILRLLYIERDSKIQKIVCEVLWLNNWLSIFRRHGSASTGR